MPHAVWSGLTLLQAEFYHAALFGSVIGQLKAGTTSPPPTADPGRSTSDFSASFSFVFRAFLVSFADSKAVLSFVWDKTLTGGWGLRFAFRSHYVAEL